MGSTGFVGGHLAREHNFEYSVHRSDIASIVGLTTDLLVCAGLPAEKWRANQDPAADWTNMVELAQVLSSIRAEKAVLISTVDVYQPASGVDERTAPQFNGVHAYGTHRAWFESFFQARFPNALVLRLPALFAADVRKNLVHDLLNRRADQWAAVHPASTFQWFDVTNAWSTIKRAIDEGISLLNVTSEPIAAQDVADLFGVILETKSKPKIYDVRSIYAETFGGENGYLVNASEVLAGIRALRELLQ